MATKRPIGGSEQPQKRQRVAFGKDTKAPKPWQRKGQEGGPKWQRPERNMEDTLSKYLCKILRHEASVMGIPMRPDGYVLLSDILSLEWFQKENVTEDMIKNMVKNNAKQRFGLAVPEGETETHIRAHQGHSIQSVQDDALLEDITKPADLKVLCHGTFQESLPSIRKQGLRSQGRNHIHCAALDLTHETYRTSVINGTRGECDAVIFIDVPAAMKAGIKFHKSSNNVVLTRGLDGVLPSKFFKKVEVWNWDQQGWEVEM